MKAIEYNFVPTWRQHIVNVGILKLFFHIDYEYLIKHGSSFAIRK